MSSELYLGRLAELGAELAQCAPGTSSFFARPLGVVQQSMGFTVSIVYRVERVLGNDLTLGVASIVDPMGQRPPLSVGARFTIDLRRPDPIFRNEAQAFLTRGVAAVNVPGIGCDIAGYVSAGEAPEEAYILAGDFVGAEAALQHADVRLFEVATMLLSALLTKAHFQARADRDRLTALMSSARIRRELEASLQRHAGGDGPLAVVLADVDEFKRINDGHGHLQGDAVLAELGRLIAAWQRAGREHAGRYGGEEFLLLLEAMAPAEVADRLEELRRTVEQHFFSRVGTDVAAIPDAGLAVTLSFGVCFVGKDDLRATASEALARADRALYAAKQAGRNCIIGLSGVGG